jgi:diguanylate cyclase (GGDEF)-like protein
VFARIFRLLLCVLAFAPCAPAAAHPKPSQLIEMKDRMCFAVAQGGTDLAATEIARLGYRCDARPTDYHDGWLWFRFDGPELRELQAPWHVMIDQTRFERIRVLFVHADGATTEDDVRSGDADGHWAVGGFLVVDAPRHAAPVVSVHVGIDRLVNERTMRKIRAVSGQEYERTQHRWIALVCLFAGVVGASLAYTAFLYAGLRHAFLRQYALWCLAVLAYGLGWSNLLFHAAPGLAGSWGVRLNLYTAGAATLFAGLFLASFLEQDALPRRMRRLLVATSWASLALAILASFDGIGAGYAFVLDRALNVVVAFGMALVLACVAVAWRRGSRSVRFYAIAWSPALLAFLLRMARNFHLVAHADWIDMCLFGATIIETMLLSAAISDRFRKLEFECNSARAESAELSRIADTDMLTGIYNRRGFVSRTERIMASGGTPALVLIDIDRFKSINDRYGHDGGDEVLRAVGAVLATLPEPGHVVGRLGGEEFGILSAGGDGGPLAIAERIQRELGELSFGFGETLRVGVSIGVAPAAAGETFVSLYRRTDEALYEAKHGGRGCIVEAAPARSVRRAA